MESGIHRNCSCTTIRTPEAAWHFPSQIRRMRRAWKNTLHHYKSLKLQFLTLATCPALHWQFRSFTPSHPSSRCNILQRNPRLREVISPHLFCRVIQTELFWIHHPKPSHHATLSPQIIKSDHLGFVFADPELDLKLPSLCNHFLPGLLKHWLQQWNFSTVEGNDILTAPIFSNSLFEDHLGLPLGKISK